MQRSEEALDAVAAAAAVVAGAASAAVTDSTAYGSAVCKRLTVAVDIASDRQRRLSRLRQSSPPSITAATLSPQTT